MFNDPLTWRSFYVIVGVFAATYAVLGVHVTTQAVSTAHIEQQERSDLLKMMDELR